LRQVSDPHFAIYVIVMVMVGFGENRRHSPVRDFMSLCVPSAYSLGSGSFFTLLPLVVKKRGLGTAYGQPPLALLDHD